MHIKTICFNMGGVMLLCTVNAQSPKITGPDEVEVGKPYTYQVEFNQADVTITDIQWNGSEIGSQSNQVPGSINNMNFFPVSSGTTKSASYIFGSDFAPTPFAKVKVEVFFNSSSSPNGTMLQATFDVEILGISDFEIIGPSEILKCCSSPLVYTADGYGPSPSSYAFSWSYPANWIVSGSATSESIILIPDGNSAGLVSCTIKRPTASNAYFKTRSKQTQLKNQFITKGNSFKQGKICYNEVLTYEVAALCSASSYNWTFPSGWIIQSGQGSNTLVVLVSNSAIDGSVLVAVSFSNGCAPVSSSFVLDVLTEAPSSVKDDKAAGSYENYHCGNWKYCFPGFSYGNLIFAEDLPSVQQWTFRTQHPFRVNGQLQVTVDYPYAVVTCQTNPAPNIGNLQIQGVNCQGASPWFTVGFVKEIDFWCTESSYPPYCECCTPPCAACPPYMVNEINPDLLNKFENNSALKGVDDAKSIFLQDLVVYPNPSTNSVNIQGYQKGSDIMIFNSSSNLVYITKQTSGPELLIDISRFVSGMYIISEYNGVEYRYTHFIKTAQ